MLVRVRPRLSQGSNQERSAVHLGKGKSWAPWCAAELSELPAFTPAKSTQEPWDCTQCLFLQPLLTPSSFLPCAAREPVQRLVVTCQCLRTSCPAADSLIQSLFKASLPSLWLSHRGLASFLWKHSVGHTLSHGSCLFIQPHHTYMLVCVDSYMFVATSSYVDLC